MSANKFTDEFKRDAVAQVEDRGYPVREATTSPCRDQVMRRFAPGVSMSSRFSHRTSIDR